MKTSVECTNAVMAGGFCQGRLYTDLAGTSNNFPLTDSPDSALPIHPAAWAINIMVGIICLPAVMFSRVNIFTQGFDAIVHQRCTKALQ